MRLTSAALILAALAAGSQAAIDYPELRQCEALWANQLTSNGKPLCQDGSFATSVAMAVRGAALDAFGDDYSRITPEHIASLLPSGLSDGTLTSEHIQFIESLSENISYLGSRDRDFYKLCKNAESASTIVFVELEQDGLRSIALVSDCVDDGAEAIRVMHPRTGYTEVPVEEIVRAHEFRFDYLLNSTSYPEETLALRNGDLSASYTIPFNYPLYTQCDPRWKNNWMGSKTICAVGCLMSSVSMSIAGHGNKFYAGGKLSSSNPGTFNSFLRANGGYQGNLFVHGVVSRVCTSGKTKGCKMSFSGGWGRGLPASSIKSFLAKKRTLVANVKNGGHFVLAVGYDKANPDRIITRDPARGDPVVYSNSRDIVGWKIYDIYGPNTGVRSEFPEFDESNLRELTDEEIEAEMAEDDIAEIMDRLENDYYM